MLSRKNVSLEDMKSDLLDIVANLSCLMDVEYQLLQNNDAQSNEDMKLVVYDKKNLATAYAEYCALFKGLPVEMKEEMGEFADQHRAFLEDFREKMQRNLTLIEARYKYSELLIKSVLDENRDLGAIAVSYNDHALREPSHVTMLGQHLLS